MKLIVKLLTAALILLTVPLVAVPSQAAPSKAPSISSIDQRQLVIAGGQRVTILGKNFDTVTEVLIDGQRALIESRTATEMIIVTPAHATATVDLAVVNPVGQALFKGAFKYRPSGRIPAPIPDLPDTLKIGRSVTLKALYSEWAVTIKVAKASSRICTVKGLVITGKAKGECELTVDVVPDTMDRVYKLHTGFTAITITR